MRGVVFMNTLEWFWNHEDDEHRGDRFDAVEVMQSGFHAEVRTASGDLLLTTPQMWSYQQRTTKPERCNLYCMYACLAERNPFPLDDRLSKFGDTVLVLTNPDAFHARVRRTIRKLNHGF